MYKSLFVTAVLCNLAACAQPQPVARMPTAAEVEAGAAVPCPPGLEGYCIRRQGKLAQASLKVDYARKMLAIDKDAYAKHPDTAHSINVQESEERLRLAIAQQDRASSP